MVSILHPSRQRAEKSYWVTRNWVNQAGTDIELIVSIDDDDPQRADYLRLYSQADPFTTKVISNPNRSAVDAINNAAKEAKGDIFIVVSDDTECFNNWGNVILNAVIGRRDYVLRVDDGIQKWIVTSPIIDRTYYNRFGYIYHPDYLHMFSDTHFTHVADMLGKIIRRDDIKFPHAHYSVRKAQKDNLYERNDRTWNQGKETYLRHFKENFGLTGFDHWAINNYSHVNWIRQAIR